MKLLDNIILFTIAGSVLGSVISPFKVAGSSRKLPLIKGRSNPPKVAPRKPVPSYSEVARNPVLAQVGRAPNLDPVSSSKNEIANHVLKVWIARANVSRNDLPQKPKIVATCPGFEIDQHFEVPNNTAETESPCPFLNSLRNEGILPRDGRRMPMDLWKCALKQIGIGSSVINLLIGGAFSIATKDDDGIARLSLADLRKHGFIEHDRSLSRFDLNQYGDAWSPAMEKIVALSYFLDHGPSIDEPFVMTFDGIVNWRRFVELDDANSAAVYGAKERAIAIGESALLWQLLNKDGKYISLVDLVDFFSEKLPKHLNQVSMLSVLGSMTAIRWGLSKDTTMAQVKNVLSVTNDAQLKTEMQAELAKWKAAMNNE